MSESTEAEPGIRTTTRRSLLTALPATGAMLLLPATAGAGLLLQGPGPIDRHFADWLAARRVINDTTHDEAPQRAWDAWDAAEAAILALPTVTPSDLAKKICVFTDGQMLTGWCDGIVQYELLALALEGEELS